MKIDYTHAEYYSRQSRRDSALICAVCAVAWLVVVAIVVISHLIRG
jgi:hypothetical protein